MPGTSYLRDTAALRGIEARAAAALGDAFELMRRAGHAAWREVLQHWPQAQRILVVCGPGNNGGDGYVLARQALMSGRQVQVVRLAEHAPRTQLARRASEDFVPHGQVREFDGRLPAADLVVDALFGIGLTRAPDAASGAVIEAIKAHAAPVFALDVPSGIDSDLGCAPGAAVYATRTVEFITGKPGLRTGVAMDHVGRLSLASLDLPPEFVNDAAIAAEMLVAADLSRWLQPRPRNSHKGTNGRVLCVGGDHGSGGAIMLCAEAALRSGAGLVDVATREIHIPALLARLPETLAHVPTHASQFQASLDRADVIAIGPGLGQEDWGKPLLPQAIATGKPLVLDADALNLLAATPLQLPADAIITPHPGEAARLLGSSIAEVQRDRFSAARELSARYRCIVVLKGAGSVIASPDHLSRVIAAGNPGMAVGGMGDVLTGTIAALRAQGFTAFDATSVGALLHAAAGDAAAGDGERGLLPSDLMPWLRRLANPEMKA